MPRLPIVAGNMSDSCSPVFTPAVFIFRHFEPCSRALSSHLFCTPFEIKHAPALGPSSLSDAMESFTRPACFPFVLIYIRIDSSSPILSDRLFVRHGSFLRRWDDNLNIAPRHRCSLTTVPAEQPNSSSVGNVSVFQPYIAPTS